jgi:hypothetical protein
MITLMHFAICVPTDSLVVVVCEDTDNGWVFVVNM